MSNKTLGTLLMAAGFCAMFWCFGYTYGHRAGEKRQLADDCLLVCSYELIMISDSNPDECLNRCNSKDYFRDLDEQATSETVSDNSVEL